MKNFFTKLFDWLEKHGKTATVPLMAVVVLLPAIGVAGSFYREGPPDSWLPLLPVLAWLVIGGAVCRLLYRGFRPLESALELGETIIDRPDRQFVRQKFFLQFKFELGRVVLTDRRLLLVPSPFKSPVSPFGDMRLPGRGARGKEVVWGKSEGLRVFVSSGMLSVSFEVKDENALAKWKAAFRVA